MKTVEFQLTRVDCVVASLPPPLVFDVSMFVCCVFVWLLKTENHLVLYIRISKYVFVRMTVIDRDQSDLIGNFDIHCIYLLIMLHCITLSKSSCNQ